MGRFRLFVVVAAAASVAALAQPAGAPATPVAAHHHQHPAAPTATATPGHAGVQWTRNVGGKVSGLVHYQGGLTARIAQGKASRADRFAAVRQEARTAALTSAVPTAAPATTPAAGQGTIKGRVTDSQHHPLSGVEVLAFPESLDDATPATTNANGHYTLTAPAGQYFVSFDGSQAAGGNSDATGYVGTSAEILLAAAGDVIQNARLQPGAQLRVRVTDRAGSPLAGVSPLLQPVMPYVQSPLSGGLGFEFTTSDHTGPDGTFTFRGVDSDAAQVCFSTFGIRSTGGAHDALGYASRCSRHPIALAAGSSTVFPTVQLSVASGGALHGVATDGHGDPVPNVALLASGKQDVGFGLTGSDGSYRITGLPAGTYRLCEFADAAAPTPFGLTPGCRKGVQVRRHKVTRVDFRLHRGGAITGTVTGPNGATLAGVRVFATGSGFNGGSAVTDSAGNYRVTGLATGAYRVCFDPSQAVDPDSPTGERPGCYRHKAEIAVQTLAVHAHIDVRLRVGGAIAGRVTNASGAGVPDVDVDAEALPDFGSGGSATTDEDGNYVITGLPTASYDVCFFAFDPSGDSSQRCHAAAVDVQVGETTELDESLAPRPSRGAISVTVRDEDGRRVQGVDVAVLKPCARPDPFFCDSEPLFGHPGQAKLVDSTMVGTDGRASSDERKPGSYAVCLFAYYGVTTAGAPPTGYADRCAGRTFTVTVTAGATTHLNLTLHPGGRVEGRITDRAGHPVARAFVDVAHSAAADYVDPFGGLFGGPLGDSSPRADATTHKNGMFSIRGVRPGGQKVCVQAPPGGRFSDRCAAHPVSVTANSATHLHDLVLLKAGAISGVVRSAAGHRLALAAVAVLTTTRVPDLVTVALAKHGRYRIGGLSPGRYLVCFSAPQRKIGCYDGVIWHIHRDPLPPKDATEVVVKGGRTTTGIDARLPRRK